MTHPAFATLLTLVFAQAPAIPPPAWGPANAPGGTPADTSIAASPPRPSAPVSPRWVVPQMGRAIGNPAIAVTGVAARIEVEGRSSRTTLDIAVVNRSHRAEQAVLLVPVPSEAVVTSFAFEGPASEPTAKFIPSKDARRIYEQIVAQQRDPALLEWAGWNMLRSSVFPVAAGGTQRLQISWESLLETTGDRMDLVLPRSELPGSPPWSIEVRVLGDDVAAVYSPSHEVVTERLAGAKPIVRVTSRPSTPGPFRLSIVRTAVPSASVITYPDPASGGGYFLLLAAAPEPRGAHTLQREVTIVLDRSGSMAGAAFERAKAAVLRALEGLALGERANIIDFSNSVSRFSDGSVVIDDASRSRLREYVGALRESGGTNLHDALLEALRQPSPGDGFVSTVLLVTDGIPTIGKTKERDVRELVERGNSAQRRVFVVGLGTDINVPLLDRVSDMTRASSVYLAMEDDLGVHLSELSERLRGPVIADLSLAATDAGRVADLQPVRLPDLFRNGSLVVLGHYRGEAPFRLALDGRAVEGPRKLFVEVDPRQASTANAFVPRLWASRRIAQLVDEVRQQGLDGAEVSFDEPRLRELVGEIVRLSTTWGVLTEYTSMLALEGSNMGDWRALENGCRAALAGRAVPERVGPAAVSQGDNWNRQKWESAQSATRSYVAPGSVPVQARTMNQCNDRTFYKVGQTWADAQLAGEAEVKIDEEIAWGTPRHQQVLWELVDEGRQSAMAMDGEILLKHRGRTLRIQNEQPTAP